jgi:hypothetical protein
MPNYRHHGEPPPDQNTPHSQTLAESFNLDTLTITTPESYDLDPTYLDAVLDFLTTEPECAHYVAQAMLLARKSTIIPRILSKLPGDTTESNLISIWAIGFIAGSSCAVHAVDEGLIVDSREDGDDDNEGTTC